MEYRVWSAINTAPRTYISVSSPFEGWTLVQQLKKAQEKDPTIISSIFGLEVLDSEWKEWRDELLRTITEFEELADIPVNSTY